MEQLRILEAEGLDAVAWRAVVDLGNACEAAEGLDLKLSLGPRGGAGAVPCFLAYSGAALVGYAGIEQGRDAEVCGMVHPEHRRRGIGAALLARVLAASAERGRESVLVICEDAAAVPIPWMRRAGATLESSERRMVLDLARVRRRHPDQRLELRPAGAADLDLVVSLLSGGFDEPPDGLRGRLARALEEMYVARQQDSAVATVRIATEGDRCMVYGLVVVARRRGQGIGRAVMEEVIDIVAARGVATLGLEVDPGNEAARRLYEGLGFRTVTTYRYMRLATVSLGRGDAASAAGGPSS